MSSSSVSFAPWLLRAAVVLACVGTTHSAFALVKCVGSDGSVTFQDTLCHADATSVAVRKRFGHESHDKGASEAPRRARTESAPQASAGDRRAFGSAGLTGSGQLR